MVEGKKPESAAKTRRFAPLPFGIRLRRSTLGLMAAFLAVWVLYESPGIHPEASRQPLVVYGPAPVATAPPTTTPRRTTVVPRTTTTPPSVVPSTAPAETTTTVALGASTTLPPGASTTSSSSTVTTSTSVAPPGP